MTNTIAFVEADAVIATLRATGPELRKVGIKQLSLFGSIARGEAHSDSDVDPAVVFEPSAGLDLFRLVGIERPIGSTLGCRVDLLPEPVEKPRLRANIDRDRRHVF